MSEGLPKAGQVYKHYKGGMYLIVAVATMSNTDHEGAVAIVYLSLSRGGYHVRLWDQEDDSWCSSPQAGEHRRFTLVGS